MRLTIDPRANVAYLRFKEKTAQVETIRLSGFWFFGLAMDRAQLLRIAK